MRETSSPVLHAKSPPTPSRAPPSVPSRVVETRGSARAQPDRPHTSHAPTFRTNPLRAPGPKKPRARGPGTVQLKQDFESRDCPRTFTLPPPPPPRNARWSQWVTTIPHANALTKHHSPSRSTASTLKISRTLTRHFVARQNYRYGARAQGALIFPIPKEFFSPVTPSTPKLSRFVRVRCARTKWALRTSMEAHFPLQKGPAHARREPLSKLDT